ncbi:hypothetical protein GGX14DRAFT_618918 [Mycena pura]|uniref:Uncharacterized protein n=1 Tax=Mycena pura TaxID=153505 RepID=A0AAD6VI57_9AGAR|nr:hypothetical protein GGX14DRAFT_618918 [Mycena pura]
MNVHWLFFGARRCRRPATLRVGAPRARHHPEISPIFAVHSLEGKPSAHSAHSPQPLRSGGATPKTPHCHGPTREAGPSLRSLTRTATRARAVRCLRRLVLGDAARPASLADAEFFARTARLGAPRRVRERGLGARRQHAQAHEMDTLPCAATAMVAHWTDMAVWVEFCVEDAAMCGSRWGWHEWAADLVVYACALALLGYGLDAAATSQAVVPQLDARNDTPHPMALLRHRRCSSACTRHHANDTILVVPTGRLVVILCLL